MKQFLVKILNKGKTNVGKIAKLEIQEGINIPTFSDGLFLKIFCKFIKFKKKKG